MTQGSVTHGQGSNLWLKKIGRDSIGNWSESSNDDGDFFWITNPARIDVLPSDRELAGTF